MYKNLINKINYFYKLAASPEFLKLREKPSQHSQLWFGKEIARLNDDVKNFAVLDNLIKKEIEKLDDNYNFLSSKEEVASFYLDHRKTQDLIRFICDEYKKYFPHLNPYDVLNHLESDGSLDPASGAVTNPVFILVHDLMHQIIQPDFLEELTKQTSEDDENITLLDQLNEDLASTLSNFQPKAGKSSQGLVAYLKYLFLKKLTGISINSLDEEILTDVINQTFHFAKAELRGKLEKIKEDMKPSYLEKVKPISPKLKQLVDGFLSKLKNEMIQKIPDVLGNIKGNQVGYRKPYTDVWAAFELTDLFEEYNQNIFQSSIIEPPDSSALRAWMMSCMSKMRELLNYFKNDFRKEFEEELEDYEEDE